jgi:hypothetical protein
VDKAPLKKILLILIPLVIIISLGLVLANLGIITTEPPQLNPNSVNATLIINFGNGTANNYNIELENATVYSLLEEASYLYNFTFETQYYEQYQCHYISAITSVVEGNDNNFWQYYLNNEYGTLGADLQPIKDGDVVEWILQEPQI